MMDEMLGCLRNSVPALEFLATMVYINDTY